MAKGRSYRNVVEARAARPRRHARPKRTAPVGRQGRIARFLRFAGVSLTCTALDQLLAAALFSLLRGPLEGRGFLRIVASSVIARCFSLSLNYALNHHLVFTLEDEDPGQSRRGRSSLPRFVALAAFVLALSTLGVYLAHTYLGAPEWQAKLVCDMALFFVNYHVQRTWVFRPEVTVDARKVRRHK